MNRYVCIHGHFYQPPRENPWLEAVELQDSAYPYHDWNERITADCYAPNAASRILDQQKKIIDITNNYAKISFNFGPTLLSWLETHDQKIYQAIIEADKKSRPLFAGHGSAIAQPYNHVIMPLANSADKNTQIIWGIRDFEYRFARKPEGMWLPETAVDLETLDTLAQHDIAFTILAPGQAAKIRKIGDKKWTNVEPEKIDTTMAYLCDLPSGRTINLFFYNGPVAKATAYQDLLKNGQEFAEKLLTIFSDDSRPQLAHIATDGETYGHHRPHAEMALAYCIYHIESNNLAKITNYAQYLELAPPTHEVQILENTSWSCDHGIGRWQDNCGCHYTAQLAGKQQWRRPLRDATDQLRDKFITLYQNQIAEFNTDPHQLRNNYIDVILDRSTENIEKFFAENINTDLAPAQKIKLLKLLEIQRHTMLMYTSCGWFFDDIAGIEAIQVMQYAARAIQLAKEITNQDAEPDFLKTLENAPTNLDDFENGAHVYQTFIKPATVDLNRVAAHFALSSLFEEHQKQMQIYCYTADSQIYERFDAGRQSLVIGRTNLYSNILLEQYHIDFAVMHFGDHNLHAAVSLRMPDEEFTEMHAQIKDAFQQGNTAEVLRLMNVCFDARTYSIWHLFKDEQRKLLYQLLTTTWKEIEASFRHIYENNYNIMQTMTGMHIPLPKALSTPAEFIINRDLCANIQSKTMNLPRLEKLIDEAKRLSLRLDHKTLKFEAGRKINNLLNDFAASPQSLTLLKTIESTLKVLSRFFTALDLQNAQNTFFLMTKELFPDMNEKAQTGDKKAANWIRHFKNLAVYLKVKLP